ncbi:MAG: T9SS type A sorting domain-containing protein [candidate division Zixibacteria bacterium]|nr:T9SS type A sorting domain-containing protein [Candidatus Tariuqbacter arcticus]
MKGAKHKSITANNRASPLLVFVIIGAILLPFSVWAECHVSGAVEGHWTPDQSPYIVDNTIWVESGASLIIHPEVEVLFTGEDSLIVYGTLITETACNARVTFRQLEGTFKQWRGIYFIGPESGASILQYSVIKDPTHGVNCINTSPVIIGNYINSVCWGFCSYFSNPIFESDTIEIDYDDFAPVVVIGIKLNGSVIDIENCVINVRSTNIDNNISAYGVHSVYTDLKMGYNLIDVFAKGKPVGIYIYGSSKDSIFYNEVVVSSESAYVSAALAQDGCNGGIIINNTFDIWGPNKDTALKFQDFCDGMIIKNNIVQGDSSSEGIVFRESNPTYVSYNDFYRHSVIAVGIPELDSTNIYADPEFLEVFPDSNYYLTSHSPCIDTGDPNMLDPDNSRRDMGAYYYHYTTSALPNPVPPIHFNLFTCYPNPTNNATSVTFDLASGVSVSIKGYDVSGRLVGEVFDGLLNAGKHSISWNLSDMASGVYFIELNASGISQTRKLVVLK